MVFTCLKAQNQKKELSFNMKWEDEGIVLAVRPYGERNLIIDSFTPSKASLRHGSKCEFK